MSTFGPFPSQLSIAIQQGFLEKAFVNPLINKLAYRQIADKESFPGRIGETITKTRVGLMVPNTTPLDPSTNNNLDNGLSPQQYSVEQYVLGINQYPQLAPIINLLDDETTIASFAMRNAENLSIAQATCVDRLARGVVFNSYMGGNTVITATASSATQSIDDTRGFQTVVVNGQVVPVSSSNPLPVYVNGVLKSVIAFTNDSVNVSSAYITGGTSGTLTFSASVSTTAGQTVIGQYAPLIVRPNARTSTASIQSTDLLTMKTIRDALALLVNNNVPRVNGAYNMMLNQSSMNELFQDSEFQLLNRGVSTRDPAYERAWIYNDFLDVRFVQTTETYVQPPQAGAPVPVAQNIQRPIICGKGALIEGIFDKGLDAIKNLNDQMGIGRTSGMGAYMVRGEQTEEFDMRGFYYHIRPPIDALAEIITQSSNYVGGFTVPTDVTTTSEIIPTATNAYYKRAVIIETA